MIKVIPVHAFSDNFIWFLTNEARQRTAIVDPGDAKPVLAALQERGMLPTAILITHHHSDHVGGIAGILDVYPDLSVYAPANESVPHRTHALAEGDTVALSDLGLTFSVLDVPGHTAGHIAYYGHDSLFCGDTLFGTGCGRVFDGTMHALSASLQRIAKLPPETCVYCAHEYTLDNIGFAKWVEEDNPDLLARQEACWALLDAGKNTVPFLLETELKSNPFLRTDVPAVIAKAERIAGRALNSPAEVFTTLRVWKDTEYD